jgi:hypothetical protein
MTPWEKQDAIMEMGWDLDLDFARGGVARATATREGCDPVVVMSEAGPADALTMLLSAVETAEDERRHETHSNAQPAPEPPQTTADTGPDAETPPSNAERLREVLDKRERKSQEIIDALHKQKCDPRWQAPDDDRQKEPI